MAEAGSPVIAQRGLVAFEKVQQANAYRGGIGVEAGVYTFTDEHGLMFAVCFTTPNRRSRLLGILPAVGSGIFTLELTREQRPDVLASRVSVCSGPTPLSASESLQGFLRAGTASSTKPLA